MQDDRQITNQLAELRAKFDTLTNLKNSLKPRTRALLSHCDLILDGSTLEICPGSRIINGQLYSHAESIGKAGRNLGLSVSIRTAYAGVFNLS